ncbi:NADP-dependent isocitrate dehydrogenase [Holosporaceae bacterium 'Namur']|nr:NADP-dependent isocitrate dehydrogenase [Holosporaceae bacterium 'Namur']
MTERTITVAYGDGIGPEIMEATLFILKEAGAKLNIETIDIGEKLYLKGFGSGISKEAWETVKRNKIILKSPITTPQGKGYKSLNVTFRKGLGLFANVRPTVSYYPYIESNHQKMDMVIVRENEEDLYAGIEYRMTANSSACFKLISRQGCEKIIRYAFEYALLNNRKKVTCVSKDNIMKVTDGSFHAIFDEIAPLYPEIKTDHFIVDIGAAKIASRPELFDVIVTLNLYGDIISDIAAEVSGSVGLAGSANIGENYAMFEAIHGSAPDIAGKKMANPSGLLNGAIMMLEYIGQADVAVKIQNAWLKTIEEGIHTADIYKEGKSKKKVETMEFAKAVVENLGKKPVHFSPLAEREAKLINLPKMELDTQNKEIIGVDFYIEDRSANPKAIAEQVKALHPKLELENISQRGIKVWPENEVENLSYDLWRLRYISSNADHKLSQKDILELSEAISNKGVEISTIQMLYVFEGMAGFTKSQGD